MSACPQAEPRAEAAEPRSAEAASPEETCTAPLWGPDAVRALRTPRVLDAPAADEERLLEEVRAVAGPYATHDILRHHLRASHGKPGWAVNGYLREAVLARNTRADFEPPPRPEAEAASAGVSMLAPESAAPAELDEPPPAELPACVWELILSHLEAPDVRAAACVCTALRCAADSCWPALFVRRWGVPIPLHPPQQPRKAYAERAAALGAFRCPACLRAPLQPIVYGFPSPALVAAQRKSLVWLGGDYLIKGDPSWACMGCESRWLTFPWARGGMPCRVPTLAQMQAAQLDGADAGEA